jgi:Heparinase II/III-like protein/Heparinase II/III N-terminus
MKQLLVKARTAWSLGPRNIARVVSYRLGVKLGINPVRRLTADVPAGPFFRASDAPPLDAPLPAAWGDTALLFSRWPMPVHDAPPDWLSNPLGNGKSHGAYRPWWEIPDFDPLTGDIKGVWELSRMDWVLAFAQQARQGDARALLRLNGWLCDWCEKNPPYRGPNWKCGQEASIRVMHLLMAAHIMQQAQQPEPSLVALIRLHLQRIAPTIRYAVAQDNNHGTSEAAALWMGGTFLAQHGVTQGGAWARTGQRWLEERAQRLIGAQGSFSQYSLNYHRLMLDTFCMVEVWRRQMNLPSFSPPWYGRCLAASQWLRHMVDARSGDGPNVGANDGARLLQLTHTVYRDHRPTVQLAMALFAGQRAFEAGPWDGAARWLGVALPDAVAAPAGSYQADDGGFAVMRQGDAMAMLRYPRFVFRPSQADALHLDFWLSGEGVLRDAGSFSYNTDAQTMAYFSGTSGHNTVGFDGRDQMPKISRFLFGSWLRTQRFDALKEDSDGCHCAAAYVDAAGASHHRAVRLGTHSLRVHDTVQGFAHHAVLRWRLAPGQWQLHRTADGGCRLESAEQRLSLTVTSDVTMARCEWVTGWESLHYFEKSQVLVLEVEVHQAAVLVTKLEW